MGILSLGQWGRRAGKSSKMSKRRFLLGVKCPQSHVDDIPQNQQLCVILPPVLPQMKLRIPIINFGV